TANGNYTVAMGSHASTAGQVGSFVYGDASTANTLVASAPNQFLVRAAGGAIFYSNAAMNAGVTMAAGGGSWSSVSDRNRKENFSTIEGEALLRGLQSVPVSTWNYRSQDRHVRHMGPMAQDLYTAFGLGES